MKWKKKDCEKLTGYVREWQKRIGLAHWRVQVEFHEKSHGSGINGEVSVKSRYRDALIEVYPEIMHNKRNWSNIMLHELVHVLISPILELLDKMRVTEEIVNASEIEYFHELVTTDITNALLWCKED